MWLWNRSAVAQGEGCVLDLAGDNRREREELGSHMGFCLGVRMDSFKIFWSRLK